MSEQQTFSPAKGDFWALDHVPLTLVQGTAETVAMGKVRVAMQFAIELVVNYKAHGERERVKFAPGRCRSAVQYAQERLEQAGTESVEIFIRSGSGAMTIIPKDIWPSFAATCLMMRGGCPV